ncbi:MAG: ATP-dependent Clp protease proteolytic subunit [Defluviitaleaceae bacterium]|nr:ATP-dependent Clp protease proteolytic subunit [Defluviitaleaceae bacterium]
MSDDEKKANEQSANTEAENIKELGVSNVVEQGKNPRGNIQYLPIVGHIEGHMVASPQHKTTKYEHVLPQLVNSSDNVEIDGLLILLNTVGGDVEAGLAISELIAGLGKPTVSLVIGGGHSIGVPLAVASDYSFIAPSATMTIHPIRMSGLVVGAQQTYDYFEKMQQRVLNFIVNNSKISNDRLTELMTDTSKLVQDVGTILIGEEAVKEGLIDEIGGLSQALDKLYIMIETIKKDKADEENS